MLSFSFAFCNMELSVWHVMSENNANIKALLFFFNLFNTHSGCKVRKKLVTLRSIRKKICSKVLLFECFSSLASTVELESKIYFQPLIKILKK